MDIQVQNHGSVVLLNPVSPSARAWFVGHLPEDVQTWGDSYAIEPRYVDDILTGAVMDGLLVDE